MPLGYLPQQIPKPPLGPGVRLPKSAATNAGLTHRDSIDHPQILYPRGDAPTRRKARNSARGAGVQPILPTRRGHFLARTDRIHPKNPEGIAYRQTRKGTFPR